MATRFLKILSNGNKILKSKLITATSYVIIFNFLFPLSIDVFMSGCTVFVFLSLMEYALVNIVMGDIADIEKKKSMGISNLILGSRGLPIRSKEGGINQEVCMHNFK